MFTTFLLLFLLSIIYYKFTMKLKNLPPGPMPLPILGSYYVFIPSLQKPLSTLDYLRKNYGNFVTITMGPKNVLLISGWKALNEFWNNDDFSGRPDCCLIRDRFDGERRGILLSDGENWREQRRFTMHSLHDFGFGKKSQEGIILNEASYLLEAIAHHKGEPFKIEDYIGGANLNVNWCLIGGKRLDFLNGSNQVLAQGVKDTIRPFFIYGNVSAAFPFLRYIFPEYCGYNSIKRGSKSILNYLKEIIKEHMETQIPNQPRDFIDMYLEELKKDGKHNSFEMRELEAVCCDLICASFDTTTSVTTNQIMFLCFNPELQERLYQEIVEHVGTERSPCLDDRSNMLLAQAIQHEALRMRPTGPILIPHSTIRDTKIGGYNIPKDTVIFPSIYSVLTDKEYWGDPDTFRPDRYITSDGKIHKTERILTFGKGKRSCIGERVARANSFLFLTSMIQNFKFSFDPSKPAPNREPIIAFTSNAPHFKVIATPRV